MSGAQLIPLGAGLVSALLHLSLTLGSPGAFVFAYFAQLPLAMTGLALGFMPAAVASAVAAIIVAVAVQVSGTLTLFLLTSVLPVLIVIHFALQNRTRDDGTVEWYPVGRILAWLVGLGLAALAAAIVYFASIEGGLEGAIGRYLTRVLSVIGGVPPDAVSDMSARTARFFPGFAATSWIFMSAINCVIAQRLVTAAGKNLRPPPRFREIEVPGWPAGALAFGAILSFFGGNPGLFGTNATIVATVPFFFIGLAVLHSISAAWPGRPLVLSGLYLLLVLLLWPAVIVAMLGLAEKWLRLRARAQARPTNKGNE